MDRRDLLKRGAGALAGGAVGLGTSRVGEAAVSATTAAAQRPESQPGRRSDAWVGVDVANLAANFAIVQERAGGRPVMAVVKADGYGHGLVPVAQALAGAGAAAFMVANTQEAVALRLAGITQPVLNFGPMFGGAELLIANDIQQMIDSRAALSELVASAAQNRADVTVQLHIDTGLGRMGVPWAEAGELLEYLGRRSRIRLAGVSTAFTEDPEYDQVQLQRFVDICEGARAAGIEIGTMHAASSAALLAMPAAHLDMVRPGILLYGQYPSPAARQAEPDLGIKPVLGLRARVAQVKALAPGDSVGYHRVYQAATEQTIAVLPIGYSDGYPPDAAIGGHVWLGNSPCRFVGEMSSNHCMVRVPDGIEVSVGDFAVVIATGSEPRFFADVPEGTDPAMGPPTADMVAAWAGKSVYQTLIGIDSQLPRTFENAPRGAR